MHDSEMSILAGRAWQQAGLFDRLGCVVDVASISQGPAQQQYSWPLHAPPTHVQDREYHPSILIISSLAPNDENVITTHFVSLTFSFQSYQVITTHTRPWKWLHSIPNYLFEVNLFNFNRVYRKEFRHQIIFVKSTTKCISLVYLFRIMKNYIFFYKL